MLTPVFECFDWAIRDLEMQGILHGDALTIARTVSSTLSLRTISEVPVLISIPMFATPESKRIRRRTWIRNLGLSFGSGVVLVVVVSLHTVGLI